jgi:hypothetical protein
MLPALVFLFTIRCVMPTRAVGIPTFIVGTPLCGFIATQQIRPLRHKDTENNKALAFLRLFGLTIFK